MYLLTHPEICIVCSHKIIFVENIPDPVEYMPDNFQFDICEDTFANEFYGLPLLNKKTIILLIIVLNLLIYTGKS